ncbi:MAG: hypothetical protein J7K29_05055 [Candidatus Cloacimonetes bacterium]|nr:hypothetical protein [Candidatus Cloacimonadota bacterium]
MDGLYYFRNTSNKVINRRLFYPFPQDRAYGKVDSIFAFNIQDSLKETNLQNNPKGSSFIIQIEPDTTAIYRIGYKQELKETKAKYILTTTQSWRIPFTQVNYTLEFPKEFSLDSISYIPDSLHEGKEKYIFFWHKDNFMPNKNFEINFKNQEETLNGRK